MFHLLKTIVVCNSAMDHHYSEILTQIDEAGDDENLMKRLLLKLQHLLDIKMELTSSINDHFST